MRWFGHRSKTSVDRTEMIEMYKHSTTWPATEHPPRSVKADLGEHDDGASGVRKRVDLVHKMQSIDGHRSHNNQSSWGLGNEICYCLHKQQKTECVSKCITLNDVCCHD